MVNPHSPMTSTYIQEDVQEILYIAISRKQDNEEMTRQELVEIATELGISPQDLELAELEWQLRKQEANEKLVFDRYRRNKLRQDLIKYGIVNSFLLLISLVVFHNIGFAAFVILTWGLFLTLQAWRTFQTQGESYENAFKRWRLKQKVGKSLNAFTNKVIRGLQS